MTSQPKVLSAVRVATLIVMLIGASMAYLSAYAAESSATACPLGVDPRQVASVALKMWTSTKERMVEKYGPSVLSGSGAKVNGREPHAVFVDILSSVGFPVREPELENCVELMAHGGLDHVTSKGMELLLAGDEDYERITNGLRRFVDKR